MDSISEDFGTEPASVIPPLLQHDHYTPQHPLPAELQTMERDQTVCQYCGVSYLIHNEIKNLEDKLKAMEAELAHYKGRESREEALKHQVHVLEEALRKVNLEKVAADVVVGTLKGEAKAREADVEALQKETKQLDNQVKQLNEQVKEYRGRLGVFASRLPALVSGLTGQRAELKAVQEVVHSQDRLLKQQCTIIHTLVADVCSKGWQDHVNLSTRTRVLQEENDSLQVQKAALAAKLDTAQAQVAHVSKDKDRLASELNSLSHKYQQLQLDSKDLEQKLNGVDSASRTLSMEAEQSKEQLRKKCLDIEHLQAEVKRREQLTEEQVVRLRKDLKDRENDLQTARRDLHILQRKLDDQQQLDEEIQRRASASNSQSEEMKEVLQRTRSDLEALKEEREMMITAHQNQIEQLRESFKRKMSQAEHWPQKMEDTLKRERLKHAGELKALEEGLKESFVLELQIEKEKHQELLTKYNAEGKDTETQLKVSLHTKHKAELAGFHKQMAETKARSLQAENSLRDEVNSLKNIIRDLEKRLAKLDAGDQGEATQLKGQLHAIKTELDQLQKDNTKLVNDLDSANEEIGFLQETVRKECEERLELTEAFSAAKEQLLQLNKPPGGYTRMSSSGSTSSTASSCQSARPLSPQASSNTARSSEELVLFRKATRAPQPPPQGKDTTVETSGVSMGYDGEGVKTPGRGLKGCSVSDSRKRIANMLGRR